MSYLQQLWFSVQLQKDEEIEQDKNIAIAEYLAGFINPKAVKAIRNARDNSHAVDDESFAKTLEALSKNTLQKIEVNDEKVKTKPKGKK